MSDLPKPPSTYVEFVARYPKLAEAWEAIAAEGRNGPLDQKTCRLVKLAVAIGSMREGAAHASVRKAMALGIKREEMEQVVALAAGTIGLPAAVAAFTWIADIADPTEEPTK